ncbi:hypothetical protein PTTG_06269 [Puccinia triticina 1-1 BBBD Race 1]|uniref:Uncharacterized protein n=1 Tax=Puccinia triticina (isolate 1-1 / race 1 (BBBD)) TaxID=630390 RepID=A0A180GDK5_PUCT1|nr:hypothetical protein PTTG_06269 [Puccinia triticina 1-1 BBBD Race 1]
MPSDSLVHASSGALGGICAIEPFDSLVPPFSSNNNSSVGNPDPLISISTRAQVEARRHPGESSLEAALHLIKREGFRSLYDGLGSSLIGIAVTNGIYYLFFEESRAVLLLRSSNQTKRSLSTIESMLAGAIAGTMTAVLTNPIWVVNTRQTLFEQMKNILIARRKRFSPSGASNATAHVLKDADYFILGAISKLFATGSTYPYLTVKSRMQSGQAEGKEYRDTFDGLRKIVAKDGIKGLYRGIAPKLTQSVLTAAFLFLAKERIYVATKKVSNLVLFSR